MNAAVSLSRAPGDSLVAKMLHTESSVAALIARVTLGAVIFPHGAQHLFGWFGGFGFSGTKGWMVGSLGMPGPVAAFAIVMEVVAPLLLLTGAGGRFAALWMAAFMGVAASTHSANGFFMNWLGNHAGEGFEYHLLAIALALVVVALGSGKLSIDRLLAHRRGA